MTGWNPYDHNDGRMRKAFAKGAFAMMALAHALPNGKYAGVGRVLVEIEQGQHAGLVAIIGRAPTRTSLRAWTLRLERHGIACLAGRCGQSTCSWRRRR